MKYPKFTHLASPNWSHASPAEMEKMAHIEHDLEKAVCCAGVIADENQRYFAALVFVPGSKIVGSFFFAIPVALPYETGDGLEYIFDTLGKPLSLVVDTTDDITRYKNYSKHYTGIGVSVFTSLEQPQYWEYYLCWRAVHMSATNTITPPEKGTKPKKQKGERHE